MTRSRAGSRNWRSPWCCATRAGSLRETEPARRPITIEDLLTHRSGIAYGFFSEGPLKLAYERALGDPAMTRMTPDEWLIALGGLPLAYQPGERFHYGHSTDGPGLPDRPGRGQAVA